MKNKEGEQHIQEQVDKTLQAFHHLPQLEPNPHLFTRMQAVLASTGKRHAFPIFSSIKLKPLALALMIILNILTAVYVVTIKEKASKERLISSLSRDYAIQNDNFAGY